MEQDEIDRLFSDISSKLRELSSSVRNNEVTLPEVTKTNISDILSKNKVVVVDCWAPWCAPCHLYEPVFKRVATKYNGRAFFCRLNVDDNPELADQFQIMNIPTTLIFVNSEIADIVVGMVEDEVLEEHLSRFLQ
ncbi:thiol reductase thioredoxin [Sulfolobales archaeon HS-7]|nr:thiol reductase thioredoxin [Sulfolobales archaeon HS-7]